MCAFVHMHTHTCWIHVHTHTHTIHTGRFPVLMLCLYCWGFFSTTSCRLDGNPFWGWNAFVQPLIERWKKKGATVPLPCLILCRLFAWGNCCGIYCCCILAHMFLKACSLTAEAPFFICIFFLYLGRSFVRCCSSDAAGSVICKLLLLLFSQFFLPCTYATLSPLL